jgi:Ca-activated chloride channel homolog
VNVKVCAGRRQNRIAFLPGILTVFLFLAGPFPSNPNAGAAVQNPVKRDTLRAPVFRSETSLVLVSVSVRDPEDNPIENLRLEDFTLRENGAEVTLEHLGRPEMTHLEISLLFDVTSSTWYYFDFVKQAAAGFLESLFRSGDAISIVCISSEPVILLKRTESLYSARDSLSRLKRFGAATAFFDSIISATRLLPERSDPDTRRAMVVLSDGEDNFSSKKPEDALQHIHRADCVFYSINPGKSSLRLNNVSLRGQQAMETLADQTGGAVFLTDDPKELHGIYERIAKELQVQYLLSYYSPDPTADGRFRSIEVRIPDRPELHVRARRGYYAVKEPSNQPVPLPVKD